jgi:hypothetical protein
MLMARATAIAALLLLSGCDCLLPFQHPSSNDRPQTWDFKPLAEASTAERPVPADLPSPADRTRELARPDGPPQDAPHGNDGPTIKDKRPADLPHKDAPPKDKLAKDQLAAADQGCPPGCTCAGAKVCILSCNAGCTCPAGWKCTIGCPDGQCGGTIDCSQAASCTITCGNGSCTGDILCGTSSSVTGCDVYCNGISSCTGTISCNRGTCDVSCSGQGSCSKQITCVDTTTCRTTCTQAACNGTIDCSQACYCDVGCSNCGSGKPTGKAICPPTSLLCNSPNWGCQMTAGCPINC